MLCTSHHPLEPGRGTWPGSQQPVPCPARAIAQALLAQCAALDAQGSQLLARRDRAASDALSALTQFGHVLRKLLPPSYPSGSYHHAWAEALAALTAGGLSPHAVASAQRLTPREPLLPAAVATWQALRGAHRLGEAALLAAGDGGSGIGMQRSSAPAPAGVGCELVPAVMAALQGLLDEGAGLRASPLEHPGQVLAPAGHDARPSSQQQQQLQQLARALQQQLAAASAGGQAATVVAGALQQGLAALLERLPMEQLASAMPASAPAGPTTTSPPSQHAAAAASVQQVRLLAGAVLGLQSVFHAVEGAGLAHLLLPGPAAAAAGDSIGSGSSSARSGLAGAGVSAPLQWLPAAARVAACWGEVEARLRAEVAPVLAGHLHAGAMGLFGEVRGRAGCQLATRGASRHAH